MINIMIVGAYPPPIGGNSIHIKRLNQSLNLTNDFTSIVRDPYKKKSAHNHKDSILNLCAHFYTNLITLLNISLDIRKTKTDIVHFHVSAMAKFIYAGPIIIIFKPRKVKIVLTIHSGSFVNAFKSYNIISNCLGKILLNKFDMIIAVNNDQKLFLETLGCTPGKIKIIPAFLPPIAIKNSKISEIVNKLKSTKKKIIITSGYGIPLYGFDIIANLFFNYKHIRDNYCLIFCIYNTFDESYLSMIDKIIVKVTDSVIFRDLEPEHFNFVLKNSSIYIRATDRDGDAVAIREANYYGLSVVASKLSSVDRPNYCHLFNLHDLETLKDAIQQSNSDDNFLNNPHDINLHEIIDTYTKLIY